MASPHNANYNLGRSLRGPAVIRNPGASGTFDLGGKTQCVVTVTATGTYTLPSQPAGTELLVCIDDTSVVTLVDASGTVAAVTGTSGTTAVRCTATDANSWSAEILSGDGTNIASEIAIEDANTWFPTDTVESALDYLGAQFVNVQGHVDIPLTAFRIVDADGDVGNIAAIGGVTASDSAPIMEGASTTNAMRLNFATGVVNRISASCTLPADFDGTQDVTVSFIVASGGTSNSFNTAVLVTNWNGGADVTDALTDTATTAVKAASGTIAAADVPDAPLCVTVSLTPPTHATDALYIYGCRIRYAKTFATV